ncbi:hypothetical protein [Dyella telluris]|uniref:Lipoprotein n=1 Tax=Dyella telluris TaxID=2763498 RepID=A0A7G8Q4H8_9GAMM|nr:hypothetical protein [Dyella telluris]QNK01686.1 hypothetical protein H8F01_00455 [Dyella telluris]
MKLKMGLVAFAVIGSLLTGCVSYGEIQQRKPLFTAHTDKSPQTYLECVQPKWMEENTFAHIVPNGDDRTLVMPNPGTGAQGQVLSTLSATKSATGTEVAMRTLPSISSFSKRRGEAEACL